MLAILAALVSASNALAAPCCNGSSAAPGLISSDERAQLAFSMSHGTIIGDAPSDGGLPVFRSDHDHDRSQSLRLEGAMILDDLWQVGAGMSWVRREIERPSLKESSTLAGDLRLMGAYEALPEWSYSTWKPRGYLFATLTIPTGRSLYETPETEADATGKGFYTPAVGALLVKRWSSWDAFALPQIAYSMPRGFTQEDGSELRVEPGIGASLAIGGGYSWGRTRLGARVAPSIQQGRRTQSDAGQSRGDAQRVWDSSVDLSHSLAEDWTLGASYSDQTLLGPASNTTLARSFAVSLQRGWSR